MPRRKRQAASPHRLDGEEQQNLSWTGVNAPRVNEDGADAKDNDDEQFRPVSVEIEAKRPKLDFSTITRFNLKYYSFLALHFRGDSKELDRNCGTPSADCVFLLMEFNIRPKPHTEEFFEEFRHRYCNDESDGLRLYYCDKKWFRYPLQLFLRYHSPQSLDNSVVSCQSDMPIHVLELLHQPSTFMLTYDENLTTIRVWVKRRLFVENSIEAGVDTSSANLRRLMALVATDICASVGYVEHETATKNKLQDNPHQFYEDLKNFRSDTPNPSPSTKRDVVHADIVPVLRPYQKEAVGWLLQREQREETPMENPLFVLINDRRSNEKTFFYNPFGGFFMFKKPSPLKRTYGGILAEEMGLGKTVEMLSLILLNPKEGTQIGAHAIMKDDLDISSASLAEDLDLDVVCRLEAEKAFQKKRTEEIHYQRMKTENYRRKVVFKRKEDQDDATIQCLCGRSSKEVDPSPRLRCLECDTWQHSGCVGWLEDAVWSKPENYLCPSCRCSYPEFSVEAKTTLIVAPSSISDQWYAEIRKHVRKGALSVYIYRGVQNEGFIQPYKLAEYDIVIVAYETLRMELTYLEAVSRCQLRRPKRFATAPSPLAAVNWWRLCLDESQVVESTLAKAAKMCLRLNATYKWCVTGTPIQKSVDDLYGLFLLLEVDPYSIRQFWKEALYMPYVYNTNRRLVSMVASLMWRTCKSDVLDQLGIPEQQHRSHWVDFGPVEEHFYRRTQEECAEQFRQASTSVNQYRRLNRLPNLDGEMKLETLDRVTLEQLLRPLLKLRQACCHPQLVRGGRFVNLDQLQQRMRVVTMDVLLDQMIRKTKTECEDFHRAYVSSLNGLAALDWMREKWDDAASWYREVLRSCDYHEKEGMDNGSSDAVANGQASTSSKIVVRTDLLQKMHAMFNLNILVTEHRDVVARTVRDDRLAQECEALKEKYLSQSAPLLERYRKELSSCQSTMAEDLDNFLPVWYVQVLRELSTYDPDASTLVDRLKQGMMDTKWWTRFRDVNGLIFLITSHSDALLETREQLSKGVDQLIKADQQALLTEAHGCHLGVAAIDNANTCTICVVDGVFKEYESRLFNFERNAGNDNGMVQAVNDEMINLMGPLRRGTWADSDLERTLKAVYSLANRSVRRVQIDPGIMESAKKYMKVFDTFKQEFRALRAMWMGMREHVSRLDELRMAVERLANVDYHSIFARVNQFSMDRTVAQTSLRRQLGQLSYLENLKEQSKRGEQQKQDALNNTDGGNPEECPVCTQALGKHWLVLTNCGHSLCVQCHAILTNRSRSESCRCPVCRCHTPQTNVQEVVFQKAVDEEKKGDGIHYQVVGGHSAKIADAVRCIWEIREMDAGSKCLVFSNWNDVLQLLSKALWENGFKHVLMNSLGEKFRQKLTHFKTSSDCSILLLPLKSGANGLNLIEATHVLMLEPSMNPAREQQALGRVHRIGQTKITTVHRFLIRRSVEEKIFSAFGGRVVKVDGPLMDMNNSDAVAPPIKLADLINLFQENETDGNH